MRGDAAGRLEALEALSSRALAGLAAHGYVRIEPGILQPADVYLDVIGEELRARSYVFTDLDGEELCLRPDLTVPACRLYVERYPEADAAARWCYDGPAFRFQPAGATPAQPREFRQIGLESFHAADREQAEAEVLLLIVEALAAAGLAGTQLRMGDLGLFRALLDGVAMPERWRLRLMRELWHRERFRDLLSRLASGAAADPADLPPGLIEALDPDRPEAAEETVARFLEQAGTPLIGARGLSEIATSLLEIAADRREPALARATVEAVEAYLAIRGTPTAAIGRIAGLARSHGVDIARPLAAFERRLRLIGEGGVAIDGAEFSAEFGRDLEYYTGFVFQLEVPGLGRAGQVAGGGRYDDLVQAVGGAHAVPAVGAAIHTDRLLELTGWRTP